jgi:hypothetical protein
MRSSREAGPRRGDDVSRPLAALAGFNLLVVFAVGAGGSGSRARQAIVAEHDAAQQLTSVAGQEWK